MKKVIEILKKKVEEYRSNIPSSIRASAYEEILKIIEEESKKRVLIHISTEMMKESTTKFINPDSWLSLISGAVDTPATADDGGKQMRLVIFITGVLIASSIMRGASAIAGEDVFFSFFEAGLIVFFFVCLAVESIVKNPFKKGDK